MRLGPLKITPNETQWQPSSGTLSKLPQMQTNCNRQVGLCDLTVESGYLNPKRAERRNQSSLVRTLKGATPRHRLSVELKHER